MSDDIVERLRGNGSIWGPLMREAADEIDRLRACLKECSDELAEWVEHHYGLPLAFLSERRRYDCDMMPVIEARKLLGAEPDIAAIRRTLEGA